MSRWNACSPAVMAYRRSTINRLLFCFSDCYVGDLRVSVGDFVLINNCDDPDNVDKAYVAQVVSLYDTGALI